MVALRVAPKLEETTGSAILNAVLVGLAGVRGSAKYRFRGDVHAVEIFRNGQPVLPTRGGIKPIRAYTQTLLLDIRDVAYEGYYLLQPGLFAPDPSGLPPSITLTVTDLKQPGSPGIFQLPPETVARVWNDFGPYYKALYPDSALTVAEANPWRSDGEGFEFRGWLEETVDVVQSVLNGLNMYQASEDRPQADLTRRWFVVPAGSGDLSRIALWSISPGQLAVRVLGGPREQRDRILQALRSRFSP